MTGTGYFTDILVIIGECELIVSWKKWQKNTT